MSFTAKILKQRGNTAERLYYLQSKSNGKAVYFFVLIDPPKEKAFLAAIDSPNTNINLDDYAQEVVAKGYNEPSEVLKVEMQQKYQIIFEEEE